MGIAADDAAVAVLRVRAGRGCGAPPPGRNRAWARHIPPPGARHGRRYPGGERARLGLDVHGHPAAQARRPRRSSASELAIRRRRPSMCCWRSRRAIERRALRLSLEGAGIPTEESAIAGAARHAGRSGKGGRAFHAPHRRWPQRLRGRGSAAVARRARGAGRRAGRHRPGYGGKGGLCPVPRRRLRRLSRAPGPAAARC